MKVCVEIKTNLLLEINDKFDLSYVMDNFISEMDYNFTDTTGDITIVDSYISDYSVVKEELNETCNN